MFTSCSANLKAKFTSMHKLTMTVNLLFLSLTLFWAFYQKMRYKRFLKRLMISFKHTTKKFKEFLMKTETDFMKFHFLHNLIYFLFGSVWKNFHSQLLIIGIQIL